MKKLIAVAAVLMLSGCATNADIAAYNSNVAAQNSNKKLEFAAALAACGDSQGCLVGVSLAYGSGMGETPFMKPETLSEQVRGWLPAASLVLQGVDMFYGTGLGGAGSSGFVITGDNASISGVGNNMEASGGSTVNSPYSLSNNFSWSTNNKDYSLGTGYEGYVVDSGVTGDLAEVPVATVTE